jgi:hypothetical protein
MATTSAPHTTSALQRLTDVARIVRRSYQTAVAARKDTSLVEGSPYGLAVNPDHRVRQDSDEAAVGVFVGTMNHSNHAASRTL